MALNFHNYLYSSSPPDFELLTPMYLGKRRQSPPKINRTVRKFAAGKEYNSGLDASLQQLQLQDSYMSDDILHEDYGVDIVGLTKCTNRSAVLGCNSVIMLLMGGESGHEATQKGINVYGSPYV